MLKKLGLLLALLIALLVVAHLVYRPPSLEGRTVSQAVEVSPSTPLGRLALNPPHPEKGDSGVIPLIDGPEALAARIALIRSAEVAIDVQYYIWQRDATGLILLDELRKAAERGVRVRLLLDDNGIRELDEDLAALDALPEVEIRLFNPFILRTLKPLGYLFDFVRLNRRMHNKSLTADGASSIVGGRNIGDIYFGFGRGVQFIDTDVLVAGPIAADIGRDFDAYWKSGSSHPIARLVDRPGAGALERLIADADAAAASAEGQGYYERLANSNLVTRMVAGELTFEWTEIVLVSDDPAKGLGEAENSDLLFPQLMQLLARPTHSIDLVSAYFVPGKQFTETLMRLAENGLRVRILTNSLMATNHAIVHSAYVKYRPDLLRAGVELYELKPGYAAEDEDFVLDLAGSSRATLHSKTLAVDEQRIFIGSFNFDPRSFLLNTEMGVVIDSPRMASAMAGAFSDVFQQVSFIPKLTDDGSLVWEEARADGTAVRHQAEPGMDILSRLLLWFFGLLPIEWLL